VKINCETRKQNIMIRNGLSPKTERKKETRAMKISPFDFIGFAKLINALATIATTIICKPVKTEIICETE
jgi:hypothetical protein